MPRTLLILVLQCLLYAQTMPEPFDPVLEPSLVQKGLESTLPLQVAISASRSTLITDERKGQWLRDALARSVTLQPESEAPRARRAIFDALIKARTTVPLAELLPFFDESPAAVIAVVAKGHPTSTTNLLPLLLKAEESKNTTFWNAAASLVDQKQLIHHLVQQAHFDYAISVVSRDLIPLSVNGRTGGVISGGVPVGVLGGLIGSKISWPEDTFFSIQMSGASDHFLTCCIGGTTYLAEWSPANRAPGYSQSGDPSPWQDHDRDIVRTLLSFAYCRMCSVHRGDFPNVRGGKATIVWHSEQQANLLLEEAIESYVKECVRMVAELKEPFTEAEIRFKVRIWLRDERQVQTTPIPLVGNGVEVNHCAAIRDGSTNGPCRD